LKITSNSIVFKNLRTGKVETINKDDIENIKWMKRSRGYGLKFISKNDTSLRYDGFKDTVCVVFNRRKKYCIVFFSS
jgi:structure-specific recognition protein 1